MTTITKAQLAEILKQQAKNDLAGARRDAKRADRQGYGNLIICDTKLGNVEVRYYPDHKKYSVIDFNTGTSFFPGIHSLVKAAAVERFLVANYQIKLVDTVVEG